MGMIRKTMSIGTLGLVSFRSKKERLARAEAALNDTQSALEDQSAAVPILGNSTETFSLAMSAGIWFTGRS